MTGPFTRRELLEKATAVSAAATLTIVPRHVLGGARGMSLRARR